MSNILPEDVNVPSFPLYCYLYDANERYSEPIVIKNSAKLEEIMLEQVKYNMNLGREVRITNVLDELVFHSTRGRIVFDGMMKRNF